MAIVAGTNSEPTRVVTTGTINVEVALNAAAVIPAAVTSIRTINVAEVFIAAAIPAVAATTWTITVEVVLIVSATPAVAGLGIVVHTRVGVVFATIPLVITSDLATQLFLKEAQDGVRME